MENYYREKAEEMRRLALDHEIAVNMENARGGNLMMGDFYQSEFRRHNTLANDVEFARAREQARSE